ncbi:MAG: ROK family protein [Reyranella sp.]|uniref:ROK family protein n=1 Tax=Reyranella sp. TaxID=1929291 RepID=UPI003D0B93EF
MTNDAPKVEAASVLGHGGRVLPAVTVDTYNEVLRDEEGFVGDRASGRAFRSILEDWREKLKALGEDPFGDTPSHEISKSKLDKVLAGDDPLAAGLVHTVVEEFAVELATVVRRFLHLENWRDTERILIGGGLSASHIGELAMGRAAVALAGEGVAIDLRTITHHPDRAGLIGAVHLAPSWVLAGHDGIIAADVGGTNLRVGVVELNMKKGGNLAKAEVWKHLHWRHRDDQPSRGQTLDRLAEMAHELIRLAGKEKLKLAPFVGIGCPGQIDERGVILSGGQNLPGNWEGEDFQLHAEVASRLPRLEGHEPVVIIHNDAVVQGLSEVPNMTDIHRWGILTIGTGLGNARFTNRIDETASA